MRLQMGIGSAALVLLAGCGGGSSSDLFDSSIGATLTAEPLAPQPGTKGVTQYLNVTVTELQVHIAEGDTGWTTLFSGSKRVNLFDATTTAALLGASPAPSGKVTEVRIVIAGDAELVQGDQATTVTCPSCSQSGIKIVPSGDLEVPASGALELTLDFDQTASLTKHGNSFQLDPVIHLAPAAKK